MANQTSPVIQIKDSNVGIGTSSPAAKLHVKDTSGANSLIAVRVENSQDYGELGTQSGYVRLLSGGNLVYAGSDGITFFYNGGNPIMTTTYLGNVGIGTTSPSNKLHVVGSASADAANIRIDSTNEYGGLYVTENGTFRTFLGYGNAGTIFSNAQTDSTALRGANYLHLGASSAATITINGGNDYVDIGTTSPAAKLHTVGEGIVDIVQSSNTVSYTQYYTSSTGTSSSNDGLTVGLNGLDGYVFLREAANLILGTSDAERIRITSAGNVGIGTTAPESKLHVAGGDVLISNGQYYTAESTTGGNYKLAGLTSGNVIVIGAIDYTSAGTIFAGGDNVSITTGGVAGSSRIYINSTGNVGIGTTSPTAKLNIGSAYDDALVLSDGRSASPGTLFDSSITWDAYYADAARITLTHNDYNIADRRLHFDLSGVEIMSLKSGNVGIGTTAPSEKLELSASGNIYGKIISTTTGGNAGVRFLSTGAREYGIFTDGDLRFYDFSASAERMRISSTGNVGIGTTSPSVPLEISHATGNALKIATNDATTNNNAGIVIENVASSTSTTRRSVFIMDPTSGTGTGGDYFYITSYGNGLTSLTNAKSDGILVFGTADTERLRITAAGNVGIGTTSPGKKLVIAGASSELQFDSDSDVSTIASRSLGGASDKWLLINPAGGNVGIGTTSPTTFLTVSGQGNRSGGNIQVGAQGEGSYKYGWITSTHYNATSEPEGFSLIGGLAGPTNNTVYIGGYIYESNPATEIVFHTHNATTHGTGGSERMRITGAGNVGIGTTAPGAYLEVKGDTSSNDVVGIFTGTGQYGSSIHLNATGTSGSNWRILSTANGSTPGGGFFGLYNDSVGLYRFVISPSGNVGIGTTAPQVKLEVRGAQNNTIVPANAVAKFVGGDAGIFVGNLAGTPNYGAWLQAMRESDGLVFPLHLQPNGGNVGIGTNSPAQKLHVVGNGLYTGNLDVGHSVSTEDAAINLGTGRTGNGFAYIDLIGDTTYTDYGLRILRNNGGANTSSLIVHRGTGDFSIQNNEAANLVFLTAATERMRITSAGNVGIGTTSPSDILHVHKSGANTRMIVGNNAAYDQFIYFQGNNDWSIGIDNSNSNAFTISNYSTIGTNDRLTVTTGGNVGIGTTSPSTLLNVMTATNAVDVLRLDNSGGNSGSVQGVTHLAINHFGTGTNPSTRITAYQDGVSGWPGGMYFSTRSLNTDSAPVERMRITSDGNVGIGTTSPQYPLVVNGDAQINASGTGPAYAYQPDGGFGVDSLVTSGTENVALGKPDVWLRIYVDGVAFVFPGYQEP